MTQKSKPGFLRDSQNRADGKPRDADKTLDFARLRLSHTRMTSAPLVGAESDKRDRATRGDKRVADTK